MIECSLCGRGGGLTGGPYRHACGYACCPACWDTLALHVLGLAAAQGAGDRRQATDEEKRVVIAELVAGVVARVRRGG